MLSQLATSIDKLSTEVDRKQIQYEQLDEKIRAMNEANKQFYEQATKYSAIVAEAEGLEDRIAMVQQNLANALATMEELSGKGG